jgi:hypothetical protein
MDTAFELSIVVLVWVMVGGSLWVILHDQKGKGR